MVDGETLRSTELNEPTNTITFYFIINILFIMCF